LPEERVHLSVILPIKDGEAHLRETLDEVEGLLCRLGRPGEALAVDDGSGDGTARILAEEAARRPWLRVLRHETNRGKGAALKTAAAAARGEYLLAVDADATYPLQAADELLARLEDGRDAVIGNRRDPRTQFVLRPVDFPYVGLRHAIGWLFNRMVRAITGIRVDDTQCGLKGFRTEVARELFPRVEADRFAFDVELIALLQVERRTLAQVPVLYVYRNQPSTVHLVRDGSFMLRYLFRVRARMDRLERARAVADAGP